jgi:AAA15 family ATPase/GTPase
VYNKGRPGEGRVEECRLSQTNLIVGKNATGKSKIVIAIYTLSELLSNSRSLLPQSKSYEWHLLFDSDLPE